MKFRMFYRRAQDILQHDLIFVFEKEVSEYLKGTESSIWVCAVNARSNMVEKLPFRFKQKFTAFFIRREVRKHIAEEMEKGTQFWMAEPPEHQRHM